MKCKVVINKDSGNCRRLDVKSLLQQLGLTAEIQEIDCNSSWNADGFDTVVVCGGDGTLNHALSQCGDKKLVYVPCGTLNETAGSTTVMDNVCTVNGTPFSYVCAAGSFTQIGYTATDKSKQRWKAFAYLPQVVKNYRCCEIDASINLDGKIFDDTYTLLMVLKSHRCFGFSFNKDFKNTGKPYLLCVKSVGKDGFFNRIKMFFPFFRIFFCGIKPAVTDRWMLMPFDELTVKLQQKQTFCMDGEKRELQGDLKFCTQKLKYPVRVVFPNKKATPQMSVASKCPQKNTTVVDFYDKI